MAQKNSTWVRTANPSQDFLGCDGDGEPTSKKRYIPSPEKIRAMAKASDAGGRAYCEVCKEGFSLNYMRFCQVSAFRKGFVCLDCKAEHKLQVVKR